MWNSQRCFFEFSTTFSFSTHVCENFHEKFRAAKDAGSQQRTQENMECCVMSASAPTSSPSETPLAETVSLTFSPLLRKRRVSPTPLARPVASWKFNQLSVANSVRSSAPGQYVCGYKVNEAPAAALTLTTTTKVPVDSWLSMGPAVYVCGNRVHLADPNAPPAETVKVPRDSWLSMGPNLRRRRWLRESRRKPAPRPSMFRRQRQRRMRPRVRRCDRLAILDAGVSCAGACL